jgi:predicted phosphohydrolase
MNINLPIEMQRARKRRKFAQMQFPLSEDDFKECRNKNGLYSIHDAVTVILPHVNRSRASNYVKRAKSQYGYGKIEADIVKAKLLPNGTKYNRMVACAPFNTVLQFLTLLPGERPLSLKMYLESVASKPAIEPKNDLANRVPPENIVLDEPVQLPSVAIQEAETKVAIVQKSSNPVLEMDLMKLSVSDFSMCKIVGNLISVLDAIDEVMMTPNRKAKKYWNKIISSAPQLKSTSNNNNIQNLISQHQFPGARQRLTPVATFTNLLKILAHLPGAVGRAFIDQQAELAAQSTLVIAVNNPLKLRLEAIESSEIQVQNVHQSSNPVLKMDLMKLSVSDFSMCRIVGDLISVLDAIDKVMMTPNREAKLYWNEIISSRVGCRTTGNKNDIKSLTSSHQFPGDNQRLTPVATFINLLKIFANLPGVIGRAFKDQQAELAEQSTLVIAENQSLKLRLESAESGHTQIEIQHQSINPVLEMDLMNMSVSDFDMCRIEGKFISVLDAIDKVMNYPTRSSKDYWVIIKAKLSNVQNHVTKNKNDIKSLTSSHQFPGARQRLTPVATFTNLLKIFAYLPGAVGRAFRDQQAELATRAIAGDRDLEVALPQQRARLPQQFRDDIRAGLSQSKAAREAEEEEERNRYIPALTDPKLFPILTKMCSGDMNLAMTLLKAQMEFSLTSELNASKVMLNASNTRLNDANTRLAGVQSNNSEAKESRSVEIDAIINKTESLKQEQEEERLKQLRDEQSAPRSRKANQAKNILSPFKLPVLHREFSTCMEKLCPSCNERSISALSATFSVSRDIPIGDISSDDVAVTCCMCPGETDIRMHWQLSHRQATIWFFHNGINLTSNCHACQLKDCILYIFDDWQMSHDQAAAKLGNSQIDNLRPAHRECNQNMGTSSFLEHWRASGFKDDDIAALKSKLLAQRLSIELSKKVSTSLRCLGNGRKRPEILPPRPGVLTAAMDIN